VFEHDAVRLHNVLGLLGGVLLEAGCEGGDDADHHAGAEEQLVLADERTPLGSDIYIAADKDPGGARH
jgi:hypothetical protein